MIIDRKIANPKITLSNCNFTIRSLVDRDEFIMNGGSLTITTTSEIQAKLRITNQSALTVDGVQTLFIANGETSIDGGSLIARNGGKIQLPFVSSYMHAADGTATFRATGSGIALLTFPIWHFIRRRGSRSECGH